MTERSAIGNVVETDGSGKRKSVTRRNEYGVSIELGAFKSAPESSEIVHGWNMDLTQLEEGDLVGVQLLDEGVKVQADEQMTLLMRYRGTELDADVDDDGEIILGDTGFVFDVAGSDIPDALVEKYTEAGFAYPDFKGERLVITGSESKESRESKDWHKHAGKIAVNLRLMMERLTDPQSHQMERVTHRSFVTGIVHLPGDKEN